MLTMMDLYDPNDENCIVCKFTHDGKDIYEIDEEQALIELLKAQRLFSNSFDYSRNGKTYGHTVTLHVNCNDIFYWACADAEGLAYHEIGELYLYHKTDPTWGVAMWCCKKRGMRPQLPAIKLIKSQTNIWDALIDSLPERTE